MSLLADLRRVVPDRRLTLNEAYVLAEKQANELLRRQGACAAPVADSLITKLGFLTVAVRTPLATSGAARWIRPKWVILLNGSEPTVRQRFSLAHELKHILDHPNVDLLYGPATTATKRLQREQLCDYFAGCLLMPRPWVKLAYYSGIQDEVDLAREFDVSPQAMKVRLTQLGIVEPYARCSGMDNAGSSYLRSRPASPLGQAA